MALTPLFVLAYSYIFIVTAVLDLYANFLLVTFISISMACYTIVREILS